MFSGDRELSVRARIGAPPATSSGSSGIPQGRFTFLDPRGDLDGDGENRRRTLDNVVLNNGATRPPTTTRTTRRAATSTTSPTPIASTSGRSTTSSTPNRRVNVFGKADYDISDNVSSRSRRRSRTASRAIRPRRIRCSWAVRRRRRLLSSTMCSFRPTTRSTRSASISDGRLASQAGNNLTSRLRDARSRPGRASSIRRSIHGCVGRARRRAAARRAHACTGM